EGAVAAAQQTQVGPAAGTGVGAQGRRVGGSRDGEVYVLGQVLSHAVIAVDPHGAHWAWAGLPLAVHQVVNDQRATRAREQLAQTDGADGTVARRQVARALLEGIVLHRRAVREVAAQLGDPFAVAHQLDLGLTECFALSEV